MKKYRKIILILIMAVLIVSLILIILTVQNSKKQTPTVLSIETDEQTQKEVQEAVDKALIKKLANLSEQKRMEYYATEFIRALEGRKISTAYKVLNEDFKTNYFKTEESFGEYVKTYFPKEVSVNYKNMERLGNLYVLVVEIDDILTTTDPNNFECYIVIKENEYADYELSFSVDSAMGEDKEEDADDENEETENNLEQDSESETE